MGGCHPNHIISSLRNRGENEIVPSNVSITESEMINKISTTNTIPLPFDLIGMWSIHDVKKAKDKFNDVLRKREGKSKSKIEMDFADFQDLFPKLKVWPSDIIQNVFKSFDVDNNGQISFQEFLCSVAQFLNATNEDKIQLVFNLFDTQKRQKINEKQVQMLIQCSDSLKIEDETLNLAKNQLNSLLTILQDDELTFTSFLSWPHCSILVRRILSVFNIVESADFEATEVENALKESKRDSIYYYILSKQWYMQWFLFSKLDHDFTLDYNGYDCVDFGSAYPTSPSEKDELDQEVSKISKLATNIGIISSERPPSIDNSFLQGTRRGELRKPLINGQHFVLIPEAVWKLFIKWYGGGPTFQRRKLENFTSQGVGDNNTANTVIELYPSILNVYCLNNDGFIDSNMLKIMPFSCYDYLRTVLESISFEFKYSVNSSRLWIYKKGGNWELVEITPTNLKDACIVSGTRCLIECKKEDNKSWPLDFIERDGDTRRIIRFFELKQKVKVKIKGKSNEEEGIIIEMKKSRDNEKAEKVDILFIKVSFLSFTLEKWFDMNSSAISLSSEDENQFDSDEDVSSNKNVVTGLDNLGNTCFINAVLQPLFRAPLLNNYIILNQFVKHINKNSKFGTGGKFVEAVRVVLSNMSTCKQDFYSPTDFKKNVDFYLSQFEGHIQHDGQDFFNALVDKIHEDLNQAQKPKDISANSEKKEEINTKSDLELAEIRWKEHLSKNSSIIIDLFHGQTRSCIECETCGYKSSTFDPFGSISIPLPPKTEIKLSVSFIPWNLKGERKLRSSYNFDVPLSSTIANMKHTLSSLYVNVKESDMLVVEIENNRAFSSFEDDQKVTDIQNVDSIYVYEIPNKWRVDEDDREKERFDLYPSRSTGLFDLGSHIDARDSQGKWFSGVVIEFDESRELSKDKPKCSAVQISFDGFPNKYNEWHAVNHAAHETTIAPLRTHTKEPEEKRIEVEICQVYVDKKSVFFGGPLVVTVSSEISCHSFVNIVMDQLSAYAKEGVNVKDVCKLRRFKLNGGCVQCLDKTCEGCIVSNDASLIAFRKGESFCIIWESLEYYDDILSELGKGKLRNKMDRGNVNELSIENCLDAYFDVQIMEEWKCDKCKVPRKGIKKVDVWALPDLLVLHLVRFKFSESSSEKLKQFVSFPLNNFNLDNRVVGPKGHSNTYTLFGVTNHFGTVTRGHYTAFSREVVDGKTGPWSFFDDESVQSCKGSDVQSAAAYLLFYVRDPITTKNFVKYGL